MKVRILLSGLLFAVSARAQLRCSGPGCDASSSLDLRVGHRQEISIIERSGAAVKFKYSHVTEWSGVPLRVANFISVAPAAGVTPAAVTIGLNPAVVEAIRNGNYPIEVHFTTVDVEPPSTTRAYFRFKLPQSPAPSVRSIVNAASFEPVAAPNSILVIEGSNLARPTATAVFDETTSFPAHLGNTSVYFNGVAATLLFVSPNRIDTVVPTSLAGQTNLEVVVKHFDGVSEVFTLPQMDTAPGIFTTGEDAVQNVDPLSLQRTPNGPDNPAAPGTHLIVCGTGMGAQTRRPVRGEAALGWSQFWGRPPSYTIGGLPIRVEFGTAYTPPYKPWGIVCADVIIPLGLSPGPHPLVVKVGENDNSRQNVTVWVQ